MFFEGFNLRYKVETIKYVRMIVKNNHKLDTDILTNVSKNWLFGTKKMSILDPA